MGNTFFYKQVKENSAQISWKDIFSECRKKHTKKELEYALASGTAINSVSEANMLRKWQKPWIFYPMLKGGLILIALIYATFFATQMLTGMFTMGLFYIFAIIPPIVIPFIIMIFIWELNIPKNISIYELLGYFIVGGLFSFAMTAVMYLFVSEGPGIFAASFAAFREEPAKLIASLIFLCMFPKNKKIYGLTGLVIGAAVGAGFGSFESVEYALRETAVDEIILNQVLRGVLAVGGHVLYCAPYMAAFALAAKKGRCTLECFCDKDFLKLFFSSVALHFVWNAGVGGILKLIVIIVILWANLLYIVKKCLNQVIAVDHSTAYSNAMERAVCLVGVAGPLKGAVWLFDENTPLYIGRGEGCQFRMPPEAKGISRNHCSIRKTAQGWVVRDEGSSYGTYLNQGKKLVPGLDQVLYPGDIIYLGGNKNAFQLELQ